MTREERADAAIREHIGFAMIASAIPFPIADVLAVSAVQLDLVRQLAGLFEVKYDESWGKAMVATLSGATLARAGASMVKAVPGVGWLVGAGTQAVLSGASTYAIGQILCSPFSRRGYTQHLQPRECRAAVPRIPLARARGGRVNAIRGAKIGRGAGRSAHGRARANRSAARLGRTHPG